MDESEEMRIYWSKDDEKLLIEANDTCVKLTENQAIGAYIVLRKQIGLMNRIRLTLNTRKFGTVRYN